MECILAFAVNAGYAPREKKGLLKKNIKVTTAMHIKKI
jgi:hypothetical protein